MIHAHELMLGNYVRYKMEDDVISNPVKVELISNQCVDVTNGENSWDVDESDLIGIPITEELLEKCGFVKTPGSGGYTNDKVNATPFLTDGTTIISSNCGFSIGDFKYLHELQNAYFMLTKKHLEVCL